MAYHKKIILVILSAAILIVGSVLIWQKNKTPKEPTLQEASKMGELATHKLLVQIENPKGKAEDLAERYERGDIVLIFPSEHQFSLAEKEGFLILQMDLTPAQAEILVKALEEEKTFWQEITSRGEKTPKNLKRRRFAVDLSKIGVGPDDQKGKEIGDKIFEWDIIIEKN